MRRRIMPRSIMRIPISIAHISAGNGLEAVEDYDLLDVQSEITGGKTSVCGARVDGTSMLGIVNPGDWVFYDTDLIPERGDVIAADVGGLTYIKLFEPPEPKLRLVSTNKAFQPIEVTPETPYRTLGVVVWFLGSMRHRRAEVSYTLSSIEAVKPDEFDVEFESKAGPLKITLQRKDLLTGIALAAEALTKTLKTHLRRKKDTLLTLLMMVFLTVPVYAQSWELIVDTKVDGKQVAGYYYRPDKVTKQGNIRSSWLRHFDTRSRSGYDMQLMEVDCLKGLTRNRELIFYKFNGTVEKAYKNDDLEWESVPPETKLEAILDTLCAVKG